MNRRTLSRWIAAGIMALVLASALYLDQLKRGQAGREAYLATQSARYDRFLARPPMALDLAISLVLAGTFLAVYEIVAFGTLMFINRIRPEER